MVEISKEFITAFSPKSKILTIAAKEIFNKI